MLIFGPIRALPSNRDFIIFNYSSQVQDIPRMNLLPDPSIFHFENGYWDTLTIDQIYYNYIISNIGPFSSLLSIMIELYKGRKVFVLTSGDVDNEYILNMEESLMKLIQQRYGYESAIVNNIMDIDYINPDKFGFSESGIEIFDRDRDGYIISSEASRLRHGGIPYYESI